jgi:cardiolipin synthase A/B
MAAPHGVGPNGPVGDAGPLLPDSALTRVAEAPLIHGNDVTLLQDGVQNYPAWLDAIRSAQRTIHFESYIMRDDDVGAVFADALRERAQIGVRVRVVYDWLGAFGKTPRRFWRSLDRAGVEVRRFNPPRALSPFTWLHRDHRKSLTVDGTDAFVSGLCVGREWIGDPGRGIDAWRDTGIALRGPAVRAVDDAFACVWAATGRALPRPERAARPELATAGAAAVRVIATEPWQERLLRLDQLVAAAARETLWITDAYFVGTPSYVRVLRAAVRDGVDVRLLVPGGTDIPVLRPLSQAGYRPLLEAGVRVFEWQGSMLHAKSAVVDGRFARVGSSNLNVASWMGNWELDVAIEDELFARAMMRLFVEDLDHATEVALPDARGHVASATAVPRPTTSAARGSAGRAAAGAVRLGSSAGAAVAGAEHRGVDVSHCLLLAGGGLIVVAAAATFAPRVVALPVALLAAWLGAALIAHGLAARAEGRRAGQSGWRVAPNAEVSRTPAGRTVRAAADISDGRTNHDG